MIEVFKTNVKERIHANMLIGRIHKVFIDYTANFDLDDCDNILRIKSSTDVVQSSSLVDLLKHLGFHAEVLPDIAQPARLENCPMRGSYFPNARSNEFLIEKQKNEHK